MLYIRQRQPDVAGPHQLGYTREQACESSEFSCPLLVLSTENGSPHRADLLLSAAPVESHVGAIVDSPNACVTLALPLGIFEHVRRGRPLSTYKAPHADVPVPQDILPREEGLTRRDFGQCAIRSDGVV